MAVCLEIPAPAEPASQQSTSGAWPAFCHPPLEGLGTALAAACGQCVLCQQPTVCDAHTYMYTGARCLSSFQTSPQSRALMPCDESWQSMQDICSCSVWPLSHPSCRVDCQASVLGPVLCAPDLSGLCLLLGITAVLHIHLSSVCVLTGAGPHIAALKRVAS